MRRSLSSPAVTLALGVALLGCGGDAEDPAEPASVRTATTERDGAPAATTPAKKAAKKAAKKRSPTPVPVKPRKHRAPARVPQATPPPMSSGTSKDVEDAERKAKQSPPILGGAPPDR
jgi:hypothetical protein